MIELFLQLHIGMTLRSRNQDCQEEDGPSESDFSRRRPRVENNDRQMLCHLLHVAVKYFSSNLPLDYFVYLAVNGSTITRRPFAISAVNIGE